MTIAEVSEKYGLSADTLRYYERIGLLPPVTRGKGGIRNYTESDCNWVGFIKCMRGAGIPVETLIEYVNLFQQGEETRPARFEILKKQREQLAAKTAEMQEILEKLDFKIAHYNDPKLLEKEKAMTWIVINKE